MLNETAKTMFENGYVVMPCVDKKPLGQWRKILDANTSEDEATEAALKLLVESAGCGQLGNVLRNNTFVLDFDSEADYSAFCDRFGEPSTMVCKTPNGYHVYYRLDNQPNGTTKVELFEGCHCDFRCSNKNYVICAGKGLIKASGELGEYQIKNLVPQSELQYMPSEIEDLLSSKKTQPLVDVAENDKQILSKREAFKRLLKCENDLICAEPGTRNEALNKFAFQAGIMAEFISKEDAWAKTANVFDIWGVKVQVKDKGVFEAGYKSGLEHKAGNVDDSALTKNKDGKTARSYANLDRIIDELGHIRRNAWTNKVEFTSGKYANMQFERRLFTIIKTQISKVYGLDYSVLDIEDQIIAKAVDYNPIASWLEGLKWDGIKRLDGWLSKTIGCDNDAIAEEAQQILFYGAIHRAIVPGCKLDEMVIFVGEQGAGKSQFIKSLYGEKYLMTTPVNMNLERIRQQAPNLAKKWVCELAELNSLTKVKELEEVKDYLSQQIDTYTPVFERQSIDQKRHCIFIGTTNEAEFLSDPTGNRRFVPLQFRATLNIEDQKAIEIERAQLWAEAYANYCAGKRYVASYSLIKANAVNYEVLSSSDEQILQTAKILAATKERFTINDILDLIGVPFEKKKMFDKQISAVLQKSGYEKRRTNKEKYYIGTKEPSSNVLEFPTAKNVDTGKNN